MLSFVNHHSWSAKLKTHINEYTPRNQGNVLDCSGCQNLSNPTHQGTREMCWIIQDVRTCLIPHTKEPGKCVGLFRMSEPV
jgi:hypothetical protein